MIVKITFDGLGGPPAAWLHVLARAGNCWHTWPANLGVDIVFPIKIYLRWRGDIPLDPWRWLTMVKQISKV
jgi:hypothetical protein